MGLAGDSCVAKEEKTEKDCRSTLKRALGDALAVSEHWITIDKPPKADATTTPNATTTSKAEVATTTSKADATTTTSTSKAQGNGRRLRSLPDIKTISFQVKIVA